MSRVLLLCQWILLMTLMPSPADGTTLPHHIVKRMNVPKPVHPPATSVPPLGSPKFCSLLRGLTTKKHLMLTRLHHTLDALKANRNLTQLEKKVQQETFRVFGAELNDTESLIVQSVGWMKRVLGGDYRDLPNRKEGSFQKLTILRDAALKEEKEYNAFLKAEKILKQINQSHVEGVINKILRDVALAANELEDGLDDHMFDMAALDPNKKDNIETVIRMDNGEEGQQESGSANKSSRSDQRAPAGVIKLVDAQENQFVLAKGKDSTVPHEDHHFIMDMLWLMLTSFILGLICTLLSLPSMFGYIVGGVVLGPSGLNVLKSLVQIETLGEFGVFFILFAVGLEFSPTRIRKVLKVAVLGSTLMMLLMVLCGLAVGFLWQASYPESVFIAACLSLSSTPLVSRFLNPGTTEETGDSPSNTDYGNVLLGILIMQDVMLGILMAVLPNMAVPVKAKEAQGRSALQVYGMLILSLLAAMCLVLVVCLLLTKFVIGHFYKFLLRRTNSEITMLGTVFVAFSMIMLTSYLGISMELGCFLAGVVISTQDAKLTAQVEDLMQPLRDFLACIFFASIGLHVFPQFLAYEMTILSSLTIAVVATKYLVSVVVLACLTRHGSSRVKWVASAGLAQVSEFSFVLGSRARRLGLISREVYLLILGVTTLSLLFAPVLWKSTLWQLGIRTTSSSSSSRSRSQHPRQALLGSQEEPPSALKILRTLEEAEQQAVAAVVDGAIVHPNAADLTLRSRSSNSAS